MATVRTCIPIGTAVADAWDVVRDVGAVHTRLAPGFVLDTTLDGDTRHVTFANGIEVTERIVAVDDDLRRLAYAIVGGAVAHHSASFEVVADGDGCVLVWTTDVLPHDAADRFGQMMDAGGQVIAATLRRPGAA